MGSASQDTVNNSRNSSSIAHTTNPRLPIKSALASVGRRGGGAGEPPSPAVPPPSGSRFEAGPPLLVDSQEVARLLGIGRTKAFTMMARDELPVVRIGRCVRVSRHALIDWIANEVQRHAAVERGAPVLDRIPLDAGHT